MANDAGKIISQGKAVWSKLPPRRRLVVVGALLATVGAIVLLTRSPSERYTVLYAGLSPEDAGEVVTAVKAAGVPYKLEAGGSVISVPDGRELELRLALAQKGVPRGGGIGFEVFDKQSFGTTSFVEQMNYQRALQGELARTIGSLDAVESARVHVALGERSLYRDDDEPATASVVVRLRSGRQLSQAQVRGIVHLVSASIGGLSADRVTVIDERGVVLSTVDGDQPGGDGQRDLEQTLARRVKEIVERIVGAGHAAVTVTADLDYSQSEKTEESYDKNSAVPRSEQRTEERVPGTGTAGGVAGAQGNLPGAPAPSTLAGDPGLLRLSETHNYEMNRVVSKTTSPKSQVKRLYVAVLVDGVAGAKGMVPRADDELKRIEALARDAAGLDPLRGDRISVQSTLFSAVDGVPGGALPAAAAAPGALPPWQMLLVAAAGALSMLFALVWFATRRRRRRQGAQLVPALPVTVGQLEAALSPDASGSPGALPEGGRLQLPAQTVRERALDAARNDAAQAAKILAGWLAEAPALQGGK